MLIRGGPGAPPAADAVPTPARAAHWPLIVGGSALLAAGLSFATLVLTGHLTGAFEYDDGTYFGSAVMLVHGHLPYRDFVLVQPPGLTLLLTPFALLSEPLGTHRALELARLAVPLVTGLNVLLLGLVLRHRSALTVAVGCLLLALYPDAILASSALLLEPFLNLCCLLAVGAAFEGDRLTGSSWRLLASGLLLGLGADIKLWAAFPAAVLLLLCLRRPGRALRLVAGGVVGVLLPLSPFLILAPAQLWHQVVAVQAGSGGATPLPPLTRLVFFAGVWPGLGVPRGHLHQLLALAVALGLAALVLGAFLVRPSRGPGEAARGRFTALPAFALGSTILTALGLLFPADFFYHCAAFVGPFLALLVGLSAGRLAQAHPRPLALLAAAVGLVGLAQALAIPLFLQRSPDPGPAIAAAVPAGSCVVTDDSEYTLTANRFPTSAPGCPLLLDAVDTTISISGSEDPASPRGQRAVPTWLRAFRRADYVVLTPLSALRIPWDHRLEAYLDRHFLALRRQPFLILGRRRGGSPTPLPLPAPGSS